MLKGHDWQLRATLHDQNHDISAKMAAHARIWDILALGDMSSIFIYHLGVGIDLCVMGCCHVCKSQSVSDALLGGVVFNNHHATT